MKRKLMLLMLVSLVILSLTGCQTRMPHEGTGLVAGVVDKDYEILGPVTMSCKTHNILGIISWGGAGYRDLLDEAKRLYPETDAVINITQDTENYTVALVYNYFGYELTGLAIKYLPATYDINVNLE